jgi:hypothetical protein
MRVKNRFPLFLIPHESVKDMLQLIEAARILIARMIPSEWNTR